MTDAALVATRIRRAYEDFLSGGNPPADAVRSIVRDSWARSLTRGVDPSEAAADGDRASVMSPAEFAAYRAAHPITAVRPLV